MIFIIDDSDNDAETLSRALKAYGLPEPRCFDQPPDLATLDMDENSLLILDLILGRHLDGLQVLEQMAALGLTKTPIVLVTGQMGPLLQVAESYGRAHGLAIVGSMEKPIDSAEIAKLVPLK